MGIIYDLINIMDESDFSIEMIDGLKLAFQYGGWDDFDFEEFSKLFYIKAKKSGLELSDERINQILKLIYERGGLVLEDILFIDEVAFDVQGYRTSWCFPGEEKYTSAYKVRMIDTPSKYKIVDFLDTTFFFYHHLNNTKRLNEDVANILPQLREEMNNIFVKYYKNNYFPEMLGTYSAKGCDYAMDYDEDEIINGLNNKTPFNVSIICRVEEEPKIIKMDIECDTSAEKFLTIKNMDNNYERLSDIINEKNKAKQYVIEI